MTEPLKIPSMRREMQDCALEIRKADDGRTVLKLTASSGYPVERYFGTEVLSHEAGAIRLDRATRGAMPLLFNHDSGDPIGMVSTAVIRGGKLQVEAAMFSTPRAAEVAQMIEGGLRNVSLGYRLHAVEEETKTGIFTATDWEPFEVSVVTVPADPTVGIGRDQGGHEFEVRVMRAVETTAALPAAKDPVITLNGARQMSDEKDPPAGNGTPVVEKTALGLESERAKAIANLCKANRIDERVRDLWVTSGANLEQVSEDLLRIIEQRGNTNPQPVTKLGLSESETQQFSVTRAIRASLDKDWSKAGFEAECSRAIGAKLNRVTDPNRFFVPLEVQARKIDARAIEARDRMNQQRDVYVGAAASGGYLVGTQNQSFIEVLRNRSVAFRMGARRLSGLVGNVTVPRQSGAATAYWLGTEATQITESQQVFGQLSLTPKTVGAYTEISRQLLLQSSPDVEGIVNADLGAVTSIAVDLAALNGSGTAGQPQGVIGTSGVGSVTATTLDYGKALDFQLALANANIVPGSGGYVVTPAVAKIFMTRFRQSNTDTPLWVGNLWEGSVLGFPGMSSLQIPTANCIFGDWSQIIVAEWGVLEIEVNPVANFQAGIIGVRALVTLDVGVRYPAAFAVSTSVT